MIRYPMLLHVHCPESSHELSNCIVCIPPTTFFLSIETGKWNLEVSSIITWHSFHATIPKLRIVAYPSWQKEWSIFKSTPELCLISLQIMWYKPIVSSSGPHLVFIWSIPAFLNLERIEMPSLLTLFILWRWLLALLVDSYLNI